MESSPLTLARPSPKPKRCPIAQVAGLCGHHVSVQLVCVRQTPLGRWTKDGQRARLSDAQPVLPGLQRVGSWFTSGDIMRILAGGGR